MGVVRDRSEFGSDSDYEAHLARELEAAQLRGDSRAEKAVAEVVAEWAAVDAAKRGEKKVERRPAGAREKRA